MLSEVQLTWACNFNTSPPFHENVLCEKETDTKSDEEWTCRKLTYESTTLLAPLVYAPGALIIIIIAAVGGFLFNPEEYSVCSISFRPVPRQEVSSFTIHYQPQRSYKRRGCSLFGLFGVKPKRVVVRAARFNMREVLRDRGTYRTGLHVGYWLWRVGWTTIQWWFQLILPIACPALDWRED